MKVSLETSTQEWAKRSRSKYKTVFRLFLLRELYQQTHSEISHLRAKPGHDNLNDDHTQKLIFLRNRLGALQFTDFSTLPKTISLPELLHRDPADDVPFKNKNKSIYRLVNKRSIDRIDRVWEHQILCAAIEAGWQLWRIETIIPINSAEKAHQVIQTALYPKGILLFAETRTHSSVGWSYARCIPKTAALTHHHF